MHQYHYLTLPPQPSSVFLAIANFFKDYPGTCLLYSGSELDSAQRCLLGLFPFETITVYGQKIHCQIGEKLVTHWCDNPWDGLQEFFFNPLSQDNESIAFGWLGYGMGAFSDQDKRLPYRSSSLPDAFWQQCGIVLNMNLKNGEIVVQVHSSGLNQLNTDAKLWIHRLSTQKGWDEFLNHLPKMIFSYQKAFFTQPSLHSLERRTSYINKVREAQELIRAGEIYQVNISQLFEFQSQRHPFSFFRQMCELNPAPFSAYFLHQDVTLISTSPERFLSKKGDILESRPIKGTIQRGKTQGEDALFKQALLSSPKERAELVMITDLMRNDLGKVSAVGSVQTLDLWRCEAYTNVFHLISIIQSIAKPTLTPLEIIRSCFPGGSITGCPKLRAMEVIDELEKRSRNIYTGSIGYISGCGDFDLNIAIRTMIKENDIYSLQLGSGIVMDSDPNQEYQETLFKGESLFHALQTEEIACMKNG